MAVLEQEPTLVEALARAYSDAARARVDMRAAVEVLERARETLASPDDVFDRWEALDSLVGRASVPGLRAALCSLRALFVEQACRAASTTLSAELARDPAAGWREWQRAVLTASVRWRAPLTQALTDPGPGLPAEYAALAARVRSSVRHGLDMRWDLVRPVFLELAELPLAPLADRIQLLGYAAQVEIWVLDRPTAARALLERADALLTSLPAGDGDRARDDLACGWGDWHQQQGDKNEAQARFEQAIAGWPQRSRGYQRMGELEEERGNLVAAETWIEKSVAARPFDVVPVQRLLRLYSRPDTYELRRERIDALLKLALDLDRDDVSGTWTEMGSIHDQWGRQDQALECYDQALSQDPQRLPALRNLALLARKRKDGAGERRHLERMLAIAPDSFDGHWFLAQAEEQAEKLDLALEHHRSCLALRPEWKAEIQRRIADLLGRRGDHPTAAVALLEALSAEPANAAVHGSIDELVERLYRTPQGIDAALDLLRQARQIRGDSFEAGYQNRVGNALFFVDRDAEAAEAYRRAAAASPDEPVYHANLAGALRQISRFEEAEEELKRADSLGGERRAADWARLYNAIAHVHYRKDEDAVAASFYEKATREVPDDPVYWSNVALAHAAAAWAADRGLHLDQAESALRRALDLRSDEPTWPQRLAELGARRRWGEVADAGRFEPGPAALAAPLAVEWPAELLDEIVAKQELSPRPRERSSVMLERLFASYGAVLPGLRHRPARTTTRPGRYVILLGDVPVVAGDLGGPGALFCPRPLATLREAGAAGRASLNPTNGREGCWIEAAAAEPARRAGLPLWDRLEFALRHVQSVAQRNLPELVAHDEIAATLKLRQLGAPADFTDFVMVCRALLAEEIPLTRLGELVAGFETGKRAGQTLVAIVESLRLLPAVRRALPANDGQHGFLVLHPEIEEVLAQALERHGDQPVLALEPDVCQSVLAAVRTAVQGVGDVFAALLVTNPEIRPFTRKLVELEFPYLWVFARTEVEEDLAQKVLGTVERS